MTITPKFKKDDIVTIVKRPPLGRKYNSFAEDPDCVEGQICEVLIYNLIKLIDYRVIRQSDGRSQIVHEEDIKMVR